jgi:copper homeostasis protein
MGGPENCSDKVKLCKMKLEIACFNLRAAEIAVKAKADRIEYCHNYDQGGISPPVGEVVQHKKKFNTPVFVMVRPRPGNFIYSKEELREMARTIDLMKAAGADGFVFGILDQADELNAKDCEILVKSAWPLPCTLHRAFDDTPDKIKTLHKAVNCGFSRILSSGGKGNVDDNLKIIEMLILAASDQIIIMPGGGLRSHNIDVLKAAGATEFHSSCITSRGSLLPDSEEIGRLKHRLIS